MDTPIKLSLNWMDYGNETVYNSVSRYLNLSDTVLFSFLETDNIKAMFDFDDSSVSLEYENTEGEMISIPRGEWISLSTGREQSGCYFPGYFTLCIQEGSFSEEYLFFVKPANVEYSELVEMRKFVNDFYSGLSRDLSKKSKNGGWEREEGRILNESESMQYLLQHIPFILKEAYAYIREHPVEIEKRKTVAVANRKIDAKSVQWLIKKGLSKNKNPYEPDRILTGKTFVNEDTVTNRVFRQQLIFWYKNIQSVLEKVQVIKQRLESVTLEKQMRLNETNETIKEQAAERRVSKFSKKFNDSQKAGLQSDYEQYDDYTRLYSEYEETLEKARLELMHILQATWLHNVSDESCQNISSRNCHLMKLMGMRSELRGAKGSKQGSSIVGFGEKCTPKLFETYVYIALIRGLLQKGFELQDYSGRDMIIVLSSPGSVSLCKGDITCDLIYDRIIPHYKKDMNYTGYISINATHNRPDFILSFRRGEEIISSQIVEVKWRPFGNIYSEKGDTEVVSALHDYCSFGYMNATTGKPKRSVIDGVVVVYPDHEEKVTEIMADTIWAAGIYPSLEIMESKGFTGLSGIIENKLHESL